jgi:hypothetical protein
VPRWGHAGLELDVDLIHGRRESIQPMTERLPDGNTRTLLRLLADAGRRTGQRPDDHLDAAPLRLTSTGTAGAWRTSGKT